MILVDSSVWIHHFREGEAFLIKKLNDGFVFTHPFVIGEIALGSLKQRDLVLSMLRGLPAAPVATDPEVLAFIENQHLYSLGIGYIDAHLLASARLMPGLKLWTRDRRLQDTASNLGLAAISN